MAAAISLAAEPVFHFGDFVVTNSMVTGAFITITLLAIGLLTRFSLKAIPATAQNIFEFLYDALAGVTEKVTGNPKVARELFPFIVTAFLFIVFSNWLGLIPGVGSVGVHGLHHGEAALIPLVRPPTSDLNMVIGLALCSVFFVQYLGIKYRGLKSYLHTYFNFSSPIYFFVGIVELISEFTRILSYSFRLFGNVFAGEVLIATILFLTATLAPVLPIIPLPFYFLEMFVGIIQALVFCFLTIVFAGIAVANHGDDHAKVAVK